MPNLNKVMIMGNCTRDPETKYTPKGTAITELSLAINRVWNNEQGQKQEETTFVEVALFGRTAEIAQQYLQKGNPVYIEGRLKLESWDDKQTGQKRSKLKVIAEGLQLISSKKEGGDSGNPGQTRQNRSSGKSRPSQSNQQQVDDGWKEFDDDDSEIPF